MIDEAQETGVGDAATPDAVNSSLWLALGLVGSSATTFRFGEWPIGAGEVLLVGWLVRECASACRARSAARPGRWSRGIGSDVAALFLAIGVLGALQLWANISGRLAWPAQRDFLGILFAAVMAIVVALRSDRPVFCLQLITWFFWIASICATALLIYGLFGLSTGMETPVYDQTYGTRFLGWSVNPNQFAFLTLTLPVCAGLVFSRTTGIRRLLACAVGLGGLMAGLATQSDALKLAWVSLAAGYMLVAWLLWRKRRRTWVPVFVAAALVGLAFSAWALATQLAVVNRAGENTAARSHESVGESETLAQAANGQEENAAPLNRAGENAGSGSREGVDVKESSAQAVNSPGENAASPNREGRAAIETFADAVERDRETPYYRNKTGIRLTLFKNGVTAWRDSPWVGHGVQSVSGYTGPYEHTEAHNTIIDWATFSGVFGVAALLFWAGVVVRQMWMAGNILGMGAVWAIAVYVQFGLFVRHPLFWVLICAFSSLAGSMPVQTNALPGSR